MTSAILKVRSDERQRIAAELHDRIAQNLVLSKIRLGTLSGFLSSPRFTSIVAELREILDQTIEDTRSMVHGLSSPEPDNGDLGVAFRWLCETIGGRYGMICELKDDRKRNSIGKSVGSILLQGTRELLINAAKHSCSDKVVVRLMNGDGSIEVCVEDGGMGFDPSELESASNGGSRSAGFGLRNLERQLVLVGGVMRVDSIEGSGTRVTMIVPEDNDLNKQEAENGYEGSDCR
jgi:signal transduction histidine kinase